MRRDELEHAIRAATQIIKDDQVIIIGSQSILGSYTEDQLPAEATMSPEIDIAPMRDADADALSDQLSFDVGEWGKIQGDVKQDAPVTFLVNNTIAVMDGIQQQWLCAPGSFSMVAQVRNFIQSIKTTWS